MVFQNSQAARVLSIGSGWNEIWLGWRLAFTDTGGNITSSVLPFWGLLANPSAGLANGVMTSSTSHFVGSYPSPYSPAFTRVVSGGQVTYQGTINVCKKINGTVTNLGGSSILFSGDPTIRFPLILIIKRVSSSSFSIKGVSPYAFAGAIPDCSISLLKAAMETATDVNARDTLNATLGASKMQTNTAFTMTGLDEVTNGAFDAITFGYNRTVNQAEFSEMLFVVKS